MYLSTNQKQNSTYQDQATMIGENVQYVGSFLGTKEDINRRKTLYKQVLYNGIKQLHTGDYAFLDILHDKMIRHMQKLSFIKQ